MKRVLLVDDNEENLYLLRVVLESRGYEVETARQGKEALARARERQPDLAISDILMPVMDGFTLCRAWKLDPKLRAIPFVFYSAAYTDPNDQRLALDLGADAFIVKPVEPDEFVRQVEEILDAARSGALAPPRQPLLVGDQVYKPYSEALVNQLEKKMIELEEANRQLEKTNAELRLTQYSLDHARDAVFWTDSSGRLVYASEATCRSLGYDRPELLGITLFDIDPSLTLEQWQENWRRLGSEQTLTFETIHRAKSGREFPVEVTLNLVRWEDKELNCVFARDVSERKRVEEQLRQMQKMEAVGRLAGGIAHDFNNLLTAIIGYCDLALTRLQEVGSPVVDDVLEVRRAADRAAALTRQILTFSRRQTLKPAVVSLNQILDGIEPLLRPTLGEQIELRLDKAPDLGWTELDVNLFEQVIMNLAINARDAMPEGGRLNLSTRRVELTEADCRMLAFRKPGLYAVLSVADTGCGMDEETLAHIFEPFFTTKAPGEGTGLGLSTVYGIVEQSGGYITVESEKGVGTEFRIYLPIRTDLEG